MRPLTLLTTGALALALAAPALAAPGGKQAGPDRSEPLARAEMMTKVDERFARLDINGDSTIDAAEMAAQREAKHAARAEKLASMSEEDKAKMQERRAAMKERWSKRADAAGGARQGERGKGGWLTRIDADGDGVITKEEFAAPATKRFDRLDADGDGIVTPEERAAARRTARG